MDSRISAFNANSTVGHDLRPNWAKPAVSNTSAGSTPSLASVLQSVPPPASAPPIDITGQGRAQQQQQMQPQQRNSSERDFPTLAAAASNRFQVNLIHKMATFFVL
jgi:hypothetical protein